MKKFLLVLISSIALGSGGGFTGGGGIPYVTPTNNDCLVGNGSAWVAGSCSTGTGTVTSVGVDTDSTTSSIFANSTNSITGSPVTSSGNMTLTLSTQTAHYTLIGPTSGSAAAPTFRALVSGDIPTLNQNTTGTAANITGTSNSSLTTLSSLTTIGLSSAGLVRSTAGGLLSSAELSGDVTTSGSNAATVVKVNGASVPTSKTIVGTNSSGQIVDASSASLSNNTSGTAAGLSATLAVTSGGTGQNSALTANGVIYASSTSVMASANAGTAGQVLTSNGSASPPTMQSVPGTFSSYTVSTTNNTATTLASIGLNASSSYTCKAIISGYRTDSSDYAHFEVNGSVHSNGGSTCSFEDSTIIYQKASDVGFTTAWACSSTNIILQVTGNTGKSIDWKGSVLCNSVN